MHDATHTFNTLRPRLLGIAYRMLGAVAEAEEVVQDAWLRWHETDQSALDSPEAWLVTVTTRLAIDRLRAAKVQREHYIGMWLPEPMPSETPATPEATLERADQVSLGLLLVLERLSPEARAAFLLREIFDWEYDALARVIGKSEVACRQMVSRAKAQLRDEKPRYKVAPDTHVKLLRGFADAMTGGNFAALRAMLDDGAELIGDGGGKVTSFPKPMVGGQRIAQLFHATDLRLKTGLRVELARINGEWGLLRFFDGRLESVQHLETDGRRILRIQVQRNPDKLVRIAEALAQHRLSFA